MHTEKENCVVWAQGLSKIFTPKGLPMVAALQDIHLQVKRGSLTGIIGPDGAGKTTLMRLIVGLLTPTAGSVVVNDMDVAKDTQSVQNIVSYMPQKFGLYEDLSVQENMNLYAELHGMKKAVQQERITYLLKVMGLLNFSQRLSGKLSGGMKQKLGLACTLVSSPQLLLLDEPTAGVDPLSRRELWEILQRLVKEEGLSVLVSTAYMDEANLCQNLYVMNKGEILASGTPQKVKKAAAAVGYKAVPPQLMATKNLSSQIEIEVKNLVKNFGDFTAVSHTSFHVYKGEVFGLLGPNGAGKTTTFRMLCGLLKPTSGELKVAGIDIKKAAALARSHIGYVAQKFSLYENLSVYENLRFFGGIYGIAPWELTKRVQEIMTEFHLSDRQNQAAGSLPGGYKQRLSMAAALLHKPQILFLDEPTSGIDPLARQSFWQQIKSLSEAGTTIIITTHFMDEAEYCDRIMIQDHGEMLILGAPAKIRQKLNMAAANMNEIFIAIVEKSRQEPKG